MVRVHEGVPVRRLPMVRMVERPGIIDDAERPQTQPSTQRPGNERKKPIENILRKLLGGG